MSHPSTVLQRDPQAPADFDAPIAARNHWEVAAVSLLIQLDPRVLAQLMLVNIPADRAIDEGAHLGCMGCAEFSNSSRLPEGSW